MRNILILILFSIFSSGLIAQNKYTVSGYIKDKVNGENYIGTTVYIKEILKGTTSNSSGFYSITIAEGEYTLVITYVGFKQRCR